MLYLSLIEPYLTYCCIVWASPEQTTSLEVLNKLQKCAARIIMFVHHLTHTESLFRKLNILNICDLYKCQILIFVYKCYNNLLLPICINYLTHTKDQDSICSSKNSNLYKINSNKSCRINSIAVRGTRYLNLLPFSLKMASSFSLFKFNLKEYLVSQ